MSPHLPSLIFKRIGPLLLAGLACTYAAARNPVAASSPSSEAAALPGQNSISNLVVTPLKNGEWHAEFDYFFTGDPKFTIVYLELTPSTFSTEPHMRTIPGASLGKAERGTHHVSTTIGYPSASGITRKVAGTLRTPMPASTLIAKLEVDQIIEWPIFTTYRDNISFAKTAPEEHLARAVALIDSENQNSLKQAKVLLERLINLDPRLDQAYVELARVAMKTNWGPEGLHQAESLLDSALQIRPGSVNAKILLGYVYANQRNFKQAEKLFADAARADPPNLWLWTNWGQLLEMQKQPDQAMIKYREAIKRPLTHGTYDRARKVAYRNMLDLLKARNDLDGMQALYEQRIADFGAGSCYSAEYARFKLQIRGDAQGAIDLARRALNQNCDDTESREILGLASYVKWAQGGGSEKTDALHQARTYLPPGPTLLYLLASSDRTLPAARELIAGGEDIDQIDNQKYTALALALQKDDLEAARRLLGLGAKPEIPVGYEAIPLALLPVMDGNFDAIRMFRRAGVDYSKLRYQGTTAIEFASRMGHEELLKELNGASVAL